MIWWAYAGFSGAIVFSIVVLASMIGVPTGAIVQLAVGSSGVMLAGAMLASVFVVAFRRRR